MSVILERSQSKLLFEEPKMVRFGEEDAGSRWSESARVLASLPLRLNSATSFGGEFTWLSTRPRTLMINGEGGSANCRYDHEWFEFPPNGPAKAFEHPEPEPSYCFGSGGRAARMGENPAFVAEDTWRLTSILRVYERSEGRWRSACRLTAHYAPVVSVSTSFCKGQNCSLLERRVLAWVQTLEKALPDYEPQQVEELRRQSPEFDPPVQGSAWASPPYSFSMAGEPHRVWFSQTGKHVPSGRYMIGVERRSRGAGWLAVARFEADAARGPIQSVETWPSDQRSEDHASH